MHFECDFNSFLNEFFSFRCLNPFGSEKGLAVDSIFRTNTFTQFQCSRRHLICSQTCSLLYTRNAHTSTQLFRILFVASSHAPIQLSLMCVWRVFVSMKGEPLLQQTKCACIGSRAALYGCVLLQCFASYTSNQLIENSRSVRTGNSQR